MGSEPSQYHHHYQQVKPAEKWLFWERSDNDLEPQAPISEQNTPSSLCH